MLYIKYEYILCYSWNFVRRQVTQLVFRVDAIGIRTVLLLIQKEKQLIKSLFAFKIFQVT